MAVIHVMNGDFENQIPKTDTLSKEVKPGGKLYEDALNNLPRGTPESELKNPDSEAWGKESEKYQTQLQRSEYGDATTTIRRTPEAQANLQKWIDSVIADKGISNYETVQIFANKLHEDFSKAKVAAQEGKETKPTGNPLANRI